MDSVEEASSYKYDWHASSNIQISGNRGEKAEATRAMAPSARSKNCTRTYNSPTFFPLSLALHSSPLSYGLRDTKEILLWNIQSCSLKQQEKYGSSWGIT